MPSKQISRVLFMQEDAQINVCCFHPALVGVKAKALWALLSTHSLFLLSTSSFPAFSSCLWIPVPPGKVVQANVLGIIHIQQLAGSVDKVMEGTGIIFGCPGVGGQEGKGFVITALWCLHGTQQRPKPASFGMCWLLEKGECSVLHRSVGGYCHPVSISALIKYRRGFSF